MFFHLINKKIKIIGILGRLIMIFYFSASVLNFWNSYYFIYFFFIYINKYIPIYLYK